MDDEFDGFMKTLDDLSKTKPNDKLNEPSSSFDIDIDELLGSEPSPPKSKSLQGIQSIKNNPSQNNDKNVIKSIKSIDSTTTNGTNDGGQFATMHNEFMQSLKEINDLNLTDNDNENEQRKSSELNHRNSIDNKVDEQLKQLLESGTFKQVEPEQNDTVELSISDDEDDDDDEIILQNVDDLESIKTTSVITSPVKKSIKSPIKSNNPPKTIQEEEESEEIEYVSDFDNDNDSVGIQQTNHCKQTAQIDNIDSPTTKNAEYGNLQSDIESNEPEYDFQQFGLKLSNKSTSESQINKQKNKFKVNASLPSTSSFNDIKKKQMTPIKSIVSTPSSSVSVISVMSNQNKNSLSKLKQKIKSDKNNKKKKYNKTPKPKHFIKNKNKNKNISSSIVGTPYRTPKITYSGIQTPKHSLKNSKANSIVSSLANSPKNNKNNDIDNIQKQVNELKDKLNIKQNQIEHKNKELIDLKQKHGVDIVELNQKHQQQQKQHESEILEIKKSAEDRIKTAESQIFSLECKLKKYTSQNQSIRSTVVDTNPSELIQNLTNEEIENMAKEIREMDRIIAGLNKENMKLTQQLKDKKIDLRQSQQIMFNENQKINNDLHKTQEKLTEIQEIKISELQPAAYNEIQKLRSELKEIKKTSVSRERELGYKISKLSEENRVLQFNANGIDKISFDNESKLIKKFEKEISKINNKSENEINELKRKLKWYIENQELIQNLNNKLKEKNIQIISLQQSLTNSYSNSPSISASKSKSKSKRQTTKDEHREIVVLKKKVRDLEKALSSQHPDSIANLLSLMNNDIQNNEKENIIIQQLRNEISILNDELNNKENDTLSRLRGLRQQNDKIQLSLNNKIKKLEKEIIKSKKQKGFIKPSRRINELENEINNLKSINQKKIKILKDKHLKEIRNIQQNKYGGNDGNNVNNGSQFVLTSDLNDNIQNDLNDKINEIKILNNKLNQKDIMINNIQMIIKTEKESNNDLKLQISLLQTQLKNVEKQNETINIVNNHDNDCKNEEAVISTNDNDKNDKEMKNKIDEIEKICSSKIQIISSELNEYKNECNVLRNTIDIEKEKGKQAINAMQNKIEWSKIDKEKKQQEIIKLQFEINHLKNKPSYIEYKSLLIKLDKIEKRGSEREQELEKAFMRLQQTSDASEEELKLKYQSIINKKEEQIRSLQNELSVLMTAFEKIKLQSQ